MITEQDRPMKTPFEDQRASALGHYREVSAKAHHWSSFVEHAILAYQDPESSQQGEGKGTGYVKGLVSALKIADKVLRKAESEMEGLDLTINEKELLIQIMGAIENISYALNQSPSNPPEVKENDAELNKFASTLSLASLRDQPKPEKTAEEILHDNHVNIGVLKIAQNRDGIPGTEYDRIVLSMKEYASQSSSSLRDALFCYTENELKEVYERAAKDGMLAYTANDKLRDEQGLITDEFIKQSNKSLGESWKRFISKAKALLRVNNTQDKNESKIKTNDKLGT